jgi:hypothetical protein
LRSARALAAVARSFHSCAKSESFDPDARTDAMAPLLTLTAGKQRGSVLLHLKASTDFASELAGASFFREA